MPEVAAVCESSSRRRRRPYEPSIAQLIRRTLHMLSLQETFPSMRKLSSIYSSSHLRESISHRLQEQQDRRELRSSNLVMDKSVSLRTSG
nr:hypothetical protein CFP56_66510 [Quercus suber]